MSEQEISDIIVEAYNYQKVGDTSSAIASWQDYLLSQIVQKTLSRMRF